MTFWVKTALEFSPRRENLWVPEESVEFLAGAGTDYLRFALEVTNAYSLIVDRLALAITKSTISAAANRGIFTRIIGLLRVHRSPSRITALSARPSTNVSCRTRTPYPPPNRTLPLGPCSASFRTSGACVSNGFLWWLCLVGWLCNRPFRQPFHTSLCTEWVMTS